MTIAEDLVTSADTAQEVADQLRAWAPQVAALEEGEALAEALAQVSQLTTQLSEANLTIEEHEADIASLHAALDACQGSGPPPTGAPTRAVLGLFGDRGDTPMITSITGWLVMTEAGGFIAAGGSTPVSATGVVTLNFLSGLAVGDVVRVAVWSDDAAAPLDRTVLSGVYLVPTVEVV